MTQAGEAEPDAERAVDDRGALASPRLALHQPGRGGVEAEPDREQHVDRRS